MPEPHEPVEEVLEVYPAPDEVFNLRDRDPFQEQKTTEHTHQQMTSQDQAHEFVLKSSLCKAMRVLLGPSKELETLDKKHLHLKGLKQLKKRVEEQEQSYNKDLAHIQVKVLAETRKVQAMLVHTINNGLVAPSTELMKSDETASCLLKKIKHARALLSEWKIDFCS